MSNYQDQRKMLKELLDVEEGLTNKEIEFIDSLNSWEGEFTPKQEAWLEKIWDKIFG